MKVKSFNLYSIKMKKWYVFYLPYELSYLFFPLSLYTQAYLNSGQWTTTDALGPTIVNESEAGEKETIKGIVGQICM